MPVAMPSRIYVKQTERINAGFRHRRSVNMKIKILLAGLVILLLLLQYRLWVDEGSLAEVWGLQRAIDAQQIENRELRERNEALRAEIKDLKSGSEAIEERARNDLGMIKKDETFYHIVDE
jgi:cell division protein FtsB